MGAHLVAILTLLSSPLHTDTTTPFASPATRVLIERAIARHRSQDSAVTDYRARILYRVSVSLGRRFWGRPPVAAVEEQQAVVQWQLPNDLRVDIIGRRAKARAEELELSSVFDRPWFVPRSVDDSVRIFSDDFPATGALHPLSGSGPESYRYALDDSVAVQTPDGKRLRLYAVTVAPTVPAAARVAGKLWLDSATAEVVRFSFRYVGSGLWATPEGTTRGDSSSARRINRIVSRILTLDADLEYAIQDGEFWMPYRQTVSGRIQIPIVSNLVIPFSAVTTFGDYEINTGKPIAFEMVLPDSAVKLSPDSLRGLREARRDSLRETRRNKPDSLRAWNYADRWAGGRYELHRPSNDSLRKFDAWKDSLRLEPSEEEARRNRETVAGLARLVESLPEDLVGQSKSGFGYERLGDAFGYNRVQGVSLGLGYKWRPTPLSFTTVAATVRYGFSDERVVGSLAIVRDAPGGRLRLAGYRDVLDVDPFSPGRTLANTVNALFAAHDNADYFLAEGGGVGFETSLGTGVDLELHGKFEREYSVRREAKSAVNDRFGGDGLFPENAPIDAGTFGGGGVRIDGARRVHWEIGVDALGGEGKTTGRAYAAVQTSVGRAQGATLRLKAGMTTDDPLRQMEFRAGGMQTVRGFDYGVQRGQGFWAAQFDVTPIGGSFRPVFFVDAGRAGEPGDLFDDGTIVGGGVGLSLYSKLLKTGLFRIDVSRALKPGESKLRFDLIFQAVR